MKLLYSQKLIDQTVEKLGNKLTQDFEGSTSKKVFVGLLNGGFMFFSDLTQ
mgnify:FL=1